MACKREAASFQTSVSRWASESQAALIIIDDECPGTSSIAANIASRVF